MPARPSFPPLRAAVWAADRLNGLLYTILSLAIGGMAGLAILQVVTRYVFRFPLVWSEELLRYSLIWIAFLGGGIAVRKGMLVAVGILADSLPPLSRRVLQLLTLLCSTVFWLILIVYGIHIMGQVQGMKSGAMELPMPLVYLAVPVGAAIALMNTFVVLAAPPPPRIEGGGEPP